MPPALLSRAAPRRQGQRALRDNRATWRASNVGEILLDGACAWLDCSIERELPAGDHDIVLLRVHDLHADRTVEPLVFHRSAFGRLQRAA